MSSKEKADMMKDTIYQLYSKEGRSKSYISRLLKINRKVVSDKIKEWGFPEAEPRHHASPSIQKFINNNRTYIKSELDKDVPVRRIAKDLGCNLYTMKISFDNDDVLGQAFRDYMDRMKRNADVRREYMKDISNRQYDAPDLDGEEWKKILGYPGYKSYYLLKTEVLKHVNREYVGIVDENGKSHNLQVSRLVAHAFCDGYSEICNTVNHEDGDTLNNKASNLTWMSMAENTQHSIDVLKRDRTPKNKLDFSVLIYDNQYEFSTIAALSRFLGKSETQTRRYLKEPEKHNIEIVK